MKRPIVKPADETLKFFTRELYVRFNSSDPKIADQANDEWEAAIAEYRSHLRRLKKTLPEGARELSKLCLHDAELIDPKQPFTLTRELGLIAVAQPTGNEHWKTHLLVYSLVAPVRKLPSASWPFTKKQPRWLYDELDRGATDDSWIHRVLFSDGSVVVAPFSDVGIRCMTMHAASLEDLLLQSA